MAKKDINAFMYAITEADTEVFDALVKDFDTFDQELKDDILTRTVVNAPDVKFIEHVIEKCGFDLGYKDKDGAALLHWAAASDYPETVKLFLEKGFDIEAKTSETLETPLLYAAKYTTNPQVLQTLIDAGADTKVADKDGETLLIAAAGRNPAQEVTEFLLNLGFDPEERDKEGFTALLNAARWQSNPNVISLLAEAGANITAKTNSGDTMYHLAARNEASVIAGFIQDMFMTSEKNNEGGSCLDIALAYAENPMTLQYYLMNMKTEHVMLACANKVPEIREALFLDGYSPNTSDSSGKSAMMMAARMNTNPDVIKMLRFYDAIWNNTDNEGRTVLHYAAANSDPAIYNWMLEDEDFKTLARRADKAGHKPDYYLAHKEEF